MPGPQHGRQRPDDRNNRRADAGPPRSSRPHCRGRRHPGRDAARATPLHDGGRGRRADASGPLGHRHPGRPRAGLHRPHRRDRPTSGPPRFRQCNRLGPRPHRPRRRDGDGHGADGGHRLGLGRPMGHGKPARGLHPHYRRRHRVCPRQSSRWHPVRQQPRHLLSGVHLQPADRRPRQRPVRPGRPEEGPPHHIWRLHRPLPRLRRTSRLHRHGDRPAATEGVRCSGSSFLEGRSSRFPGFSAPQAAVHRHPRHLRHDRSPGHPRCADARRQAPAGLRGALRYQAPRPGERRLAKGPRRAARFSKARSAAGGGRGRPHGGRHHPDGHRRLAAPGRLPRLRHPRRRDCRGLAPQGRRFRRCLGPRADAADGGLDGRRPPAPGRRGRTAGHRGPRA